MMKPAAVTLLLALPLVMPLVATPAAADTVTTEANTLVVVTPNAPIIVQQGGGPSTVPVQAPGAGEMPPSAQPTAAGAPQNEDWRNVSHINGTPVRVGERDQYLYRFRKNNISANPFGVFFGYYDIAVSRALSQNLAASFAITGWNVDGGSSEGFQVSATLPLYFKRTFSGPYLEGGVLVRTDLDDDYYPSSAYGEYDYMSYENNDSWVGPQLLFGWHWTFDSGLNMAMAFGVAKKIDGDSGDTDANGYFRVGYAF